MKYYFAPLEGITGYVFRCTYNKYFGGIDTYYTPFVTTRDGGIMKNKEKRDIQPSNNPGLNIVPQIMTKNPKEFIQAAKHMEDMGYQEVNLNLGCPSGTVVPKGKGSGLLKNPDELRFLLDGIYSECPINISIKSRIGFYSADEFPDILDIYNDYPVKRLILHLRTREEFYSGDIHSEAYEYAYAHTDIPLVYNGDLLSIEDVKSVENKYPDTEGVMIGRGYLMRPGFAGNERLLGNYTDINRVFDFAEELCLRYEEVLFGEKPVLFKLWGHLKESIPDGDEFFKKIKKTKHLDEYKEIISLTQNSSYKP